jgi:mRNA-degrading endonuclease RelE of RelBE toxin-antitoxin system
VTRPNPLAGKTLRWSAAFKKDYKRLPADIHAQVKKALADIAKDPMPGRYRFEKLHGRDIYTIHVTGNHAYKLSMELTENEEVILRRVARHKTIDRKP